MSPKANNLKKYTKKNPDYLSNNTETCVHVVFKDGQIDGVFSQHGYALDYLEELREVARKEKWDDLTSSIESFIVDFRRKK